MAWPVVAGAYLKLAHGIRAERLALV
jgi:hypothetical protein